jgi:FkbM family methyltransferase
MRNKEWSKPFSISHEKSHKKFFLDKFFYRSIRLVQLVRILRTFGVRFTIRIIEEVYQDSQTPIIAAESQAGLMLYGIEDDIIYESMLRGEFREPHFKQVAQVILNPSSNCIDLGANHGSHSLWMSEICPTGKIYAFEPQPKIFQALSLNALMNNRTNIQLYNLAASEKTGTNIFIEQAKRNRNLINSGWSRVLFDYEIQHSATVALDDLQFEKISLIKMDIQGSELSAIKGMTKLLKRDRPFIFFEVEDIHLKFHKTTSAELYSYVSSEDYSIYRIDSQYPCDNIAVPNEDLEDVLIKLKKLRFGFQLIV